MVIMAQSQSYRCVWSLDSPNLVYIIRQNGVSYTWEIPNAEAGNGRIEGDNLIGYIGGDEVVFYVSGRDNNGRPNQLRSDHEKWKNFILTRPF